MKDDRLPWFKCEPTKLLGALAAMKSDVGYLYTIILLRIYEVGGPCPDTLDAMARRTGFNRRRVTDALDVLFRTEKLYREASGIMNAKAAELLAAREGKRDELSQAGQKGAQRRWEKSKQPQTPTNGHAMPGLSRPHAEKMLDTEVELDLDLESKKESTPPVGGVAREPKKQKPRSRLPEEWTLPTDGFRYAEEHGFHGQAVRTMAEAFKNHHRARGNTMADWPAAWRTWVMNQQRFDANRGGAPIGGGRRGPTLVDIALGGRDHG